MACRCADCGFLAVRDTDTRQFAEVELGMLKRWEIPASTLRPAFKKYEEIPVCFVLAAELATEIAGTTPFSANVVMQVIEKSREQGLSRCASFTSRLHGFTPKEHREMQLDKERQREQQEQRERDRDWQTSQAAANRTWEKSETAARHEREDAKDRSDKKWKIGLAVLAGVLGAAGVLVGKYLPGPQPPQPPTVIIQQIPIESKPAAP